MTAPVWMAIPPEVHSALLTSGPGPASMLAAAAQWQELGVQYGAAAAELARLLAETAATSWQGPSASRYVAAHLPYLGWLERSALDSAATAAQHETAAAAYTVAVAAMPSLAELAANHVTHGVLLATNFFGINTIPIAVNEADYARMWVQAAETMTVYQAVTEVAAAAVPAGEPAPAILAVDGWTAVADSPSTSSFGDFLSRLFSAIGDPAQLLELFREAFERLGFNPATAAVLAFIALVLYDMLWYPYYASYGLLLAPLFLPALSALSALALLKDRFPNLVPVEPLPEEAPADAAGPAPAVRPDSPPAVALLPPGSPASVAQGSAGAPAGPAAPANAAGPASAFSVTYAVPGLEPPGAGSNPTSTAESSEAMAEAAAAIAAARTAALAKSRTRRTRRDRMRGRGYRHEFIDAPVAADMAGDGPPEPTVTAGEQGAGPFGFSGTAARSDVTAAGMVQRADEGAGGSMPLLPSTWDSGPGSGDDR